MTLVGAAVLAVSCTAAPDVTASEEASLASQAIVEACRGICSGVDVFVLDQLVAIDGLIAHMPEEVHEAIFDRIPSVAIVDKATASTIFREDEDAESRHSVVITIGPLEELAEDVIGFSVGLSDSYYNAWGGIQQFRWDGSTWIPATQDDTGITKPTWVS